MACAECHEKVAGQFRSTAMAQAASRPTFRAEWLAKGAPARCLACHAPQGGRGIVCSDCHGAGGHPYPKVGVPARCARCHDAPGENTVRTFLANPARIRGQDCVSCHATGESGAFTHAFSGPTDPDFLRAVARLRLAVRREPSGWVATVRIRHRAGHALPGGTTGRAVWLWVEGLGAAGRAVWREQRRFGWEHDGRGGWRDRTLPPGVATLVPLSRLDRAGADRVRLRLTYHPGAGAASPDDAEAVLLDVLEIELHPG